MRMFQIKGEILTVRNKAKETETNLTDQHKIIEQKEQEIYVKINYSFLILIIFYLKRGIQALK